MQVVNYCGLIWLKELPIAIIPRRMKDINGYVKETQKKIDDLEKSLKTSKANANAFSKTIKKLKADLEAKQVEIAALQEQVDKYRNENQNLITTVGMQEAELSDKSVAD